MKLAPCLIVACIAPALVACADLPADGPTRAELTKSAEQNNTLGYRIIDVTPAMIPQLAEATTPPLPVPAAAGLANKIGVDDVLQITVFETGLGLFTSGVQ